MTEVVLRTAPDKAQTALLLGFCLANRVDCFTVNATATDADWPRARRRIFEPLKPSSLGKRPLEQTVVYAGRERVQLVECWRFDHAAAALIAHVAGGRLVTSSPGDPEDWAFYRGDALFMGVVSHEAFVFLRLADDERAAFERLGIAHRARSD